MLDKQDPSLLLSTSSTGWPCHRPKEQEENILKDAAARKLAQDGKRTPAFRSVHRECRDVDLKASPEAFRST